MAKKRRPFIWLSGFLSASYAALYFAQLFALYHPKYSVTNLGAVFRSERLAETFFQTLLLAGFFGLLIFLTTLFYADFARVSSRLKAALLIWSTLLLSFVCFRLPFVGAGKTFGFEDSYILSAAQAPLHLIFVSTWFLILFAALLISPLLILELRKGERGSRRKIFLCLASALIAASSAVFLPILSARPIFGILHLIYGHPIHPLFIFFAPLLSWAYWERKREIPSAIFWLWLFLAYALSAGLFGIFLSIFVGIGLRALFAHPLLVALIAFYHLLVLRWPAIFRRMG